MSPSRVAPKSGEPVGPAERGYISTARPLMVRLMEAVEYDTNGGCWLWSGFAPKNTGYGLITLPDGSTKRTHRLMWRLLKGDIPPGLLVCHRCDVRRCINPDHLFLGTPLDNTQDMARKGRRVSVRGASSHFAKLSAPQVDEVRRLLSGGAKGRHIAKAFGVSEGAVSLIKHGKTWA